MNTFIFLAVIAVILVAAIVIVFAWLYERASREVSLVRTGLGGRKVVLDGGAIVIPYFQQVMRVNMQTLRLEVRRTADEALITKDRLRVDVGVEFYVAVASTDDGVALASQTLGNRTFKPDQLRELIEGILVDALRMVAATMTMDELHDSRGAFVSDVRASLAEALARTGLELASVSLSALDQTPFSALDENNAFNAVGMRKLAEVIATSKKERAAIDSDADVSVRRAAMEATKRKLEIDLEERAAEIEQTREVESLLANQLADVARRKAEAEKEAAQARITMEQQIRAADIAREQSLREAEIARDRMLQEADIVRQREIDVANQESRIVISAKSQEESKAQVQSDTARAVAVKAAEAVTTSRQIAEAERKHQVALISAKTEGQVAGTRLRMKAEAEKAASGDLATARLAEAEARKKERMADAEGRRALNEAENALTAEIIEMRVDLARLEAMPKVVAEMVKPAEKIESIKIHQVQGLGGSSGGAGDNSGKEDRSAVTQALDSIMDMAVQLPALKKIGEEVRESVGGELSDIAQKTKKSGGRKDKD